MKISARNRLKGRIIEVKKGTTTAHVKKEEGQSFVDWLVSPAGQKAIADYKIAGQQLFFPNADVPGA